MEKYSLIERERKFIIQSHHVPNAKLPAGLITDYYIPGTFMRFRTVLSDDGIKYKLTKKVPAPLNGETHITTIYLTEQEYLLLNIFNAIQAKKNRYTVPLESVVIGFDHYSSPHEELWIAEVEFSSYAEMNSFIMPVPFVEEVTSNELFNGFELAKRFCCG